MKNLWERMMGLCKFDADGGGGAGGGDNGGSGGAGGGTDGDKGGDGGGDKGKGGDPNKDDKTFTQEDLNRIGTKEKAEGKKAALKELGYEDPTTAKKDLDEFKKWKESQKTEAEKAEEAKNTAIGTAAAEKARADAAEQKLATITAGVDPKFVEDVTVLARAKMSDTVDFKAALEEVKKVYPNFFTTTDGSGNGTGGAGNGPRANGGNVDGIGKRLAESKKPAEGTKPFSYFSN